MIIPVVKLTMQMKVKCSRINAEFWSHQFLRVTLTFFVFYDVRFGSLRGKMDWNLVKYESYRKYCAIKI